MIQPSHNITNIRIFTALLSLLLSTFSFYSDDIINSDGILYLDMAEAFLQFGLIGAMQLYDWPFFAILVASLHTIIMLPLELCADILNSLLFVLFTDTLILICSKILFNRQQLIIAAIFILCFQTFNEYREFVSRDVGYWAFCSLALYRFMLFLESPTIKNATIWQVVTILAVLFRVEGVVILLGLPLYLFAHQHPKLALKNELRLNYLLIIGALLASILAIGVSGLSASFGKISTVADYMDISSFVTDFSNRAHIIEEQILSHFSNDYGALILSSGLIIMLIYKLIKALSVSYIALYLLSRCQQKQLATTPYQRLIIYFIVLNIFILLAFLFHEYFISKRYTVMALAGILLLMLPRISSYLEKAWAQKNKPILILAGIILLVSLIDGTTQSNSKAYIKDTAIWAGQNLPKNSTVLTDNLFIKYYFNVQDPDAKLTKANIKAYQHYDYLIIIEKRKDTSAKDFLKNGTLNLIHSVQNRRKDRASIYRITTRP